MIDAGVLRDAVAVHGTPLYVYDLDAIASRVEALRAVLPERVELAYAVKANPAIAVLRAIAGTGIGADVASAGELAAMRAADFDPGTVVYTGPGKRPDELDAAAGLGLRAITVESPAEVDRLADAARRAGRRVPIMLRAGSDGPTDNVIGASPGRFGMPLDDLLRTARRCAALEDLELVGIHRFEASNVLEADALLASARDAVRIAAQVARAADRRLALVDLGGGLGIPYRDDEQPLDAGRLAGGLAALLDELDADPRLAGGRLLLEPGRFLVGPCGSYVTRVVDVKNGPQGLVVTVDGGVHHLLRPALVGASHRIRSLAIGGARPLKGCLVGGPLCTGLDVLGRATLPEPRVGDLLAVDDAGAYGFTQSMPLFLSHPTPAEVVIDAGRLRLARRRTGPDELIAAQVELLTAPVAAT